MPAWTCTKCDRQFGRRGQSHECAPAMSLEDYFSTGPAHERPVFDAVISHLRQVGPVHVEPVSVGIFLKRSRTFAELRPMTKWVAVSFSLLHPAKHKLITRKVAQYNGRYYHVANVANSAEVDERLLSLLTEADFSSPE
jgi:Domain of unknown function (DUF5655)